MRGVDFEVYWRPTDSLIVTSYPGRFVLDFPLDVLKFGKSSVWDMMELCPFPLLWWWATIWAIFLLGWDIYELEDKRSSGDDTTSTRKKILSDDIFEN